MRLEAPIQGEKSGEINYTIAIPAFNAQTSLPRLLDFLSVAAPPEIREVVVCDSLSRDATAAIVVAHAGMDSRVRLVTAARPGKPAAWNELMAAANTQGVLFLDADVLPTAHCLPRLVEAFERSRALVVGGRRKPYSGGPISRRAAHWLFDPVVELCLAGTCYVLDRPAILARMRSLGLEAMPDVFADDLWLQSILLRGEFEVCQEATILIRVEGFDHYRLFHARKKLVSFELEEMHPERGAALGARFPEALGPLAQAHRVASAPLRFMTRLRWFVGAGAKYAANLVWARRLEAIAEGLIESCRREGGSNLLRHDASTSPGRAAPLAVTLRQGRPDPGDALRFAELHDLATGKRSRLQFGHSWRKVIVAEYLSSDSVYSHRWTRFACLGDEIVGHLTCLPAADHARARSLPRAAGWPAIRRKAIQRLRAWRGIRPNGVQPGELHLASIAVDPRHRRRRVASILLTEAISSAARTTCNQLGADVDPRNIPALDAYRRLGFEVHPGANGSTLLKISLPLTQEARVGRAHRREYDERGFLRESFQLRDASVLPQLRRDVEHFDRILAEWKELGYARVPYLFTEAIEHVAFDPGIRTVIEPLLGTDRWVVWGPNIRRATPNAASHWHVDLESFYWPSVTVVVGLSGCAPRSATWCLPGTHVLSEAPASCGDAGDTDRVLYRALRIKPDCGLPEQFASFGDGRFYAFDARTWHRGDSGSSTNRLALFLHYQRADMPRVPFMLDYDRHRWAPEPAAFRAGPGVEPVREVARIPLRERARGLLARLRR